MSGNTEAVVRVAATPGASTERVIQNSDGTFVRSTMPPPSQSGPAIGTSKVSVEVGGSTGGALAQAARERVARMAAGRGAAPAETAPPAKESAQPAQPPPAHADPAAPAPAAGASPSSSAPAPAPAESAPTTPPPAAEPEEMVSLRERVARQTQLLERAGIEIERLSKGQADETRARVEALRAAEDGYLDNPVQAVRRYLASSLGVDSDAHPDIDAELDALIRDLIASRHPGTVQIDEAQRANRTSTLLQRSWNKDRQRAEAKQREFETSEQRRQAELADKNDQQIIARHLETNRQQHPHLIALSGPFDGIAPEAKVLEAIKVGIATGHIPRNTPPERLLALGAELAEKHYRARLDVIQKARPNNDTAAPSPPPGQLAGAANADVKEGTVRQSHGARSITNAVASVAPAGAVETKPEPVPKRPETSEERARRVMQKHGIKTRR